jgi:hypothetical protein
MFVYSTSAVANVTWHQDPENFAVMGFVNPELINIISHQYNSLSRCETEIPAAKCSITILLDRRF